MSSFWEDTNAIPGVIKHYLGRFAVLVLRYKDKYYESSVVTLHFWALFYLYNRFPVRGIMIFQRWKIVAFYSLHKSYP